eukprot:1393014-Amorphochlora_amoeboformis.AAC.1
MSQAVRPGKLGHRPLDQAVGPGKPCHRPLDQVSHVTAKSKPRLGQGCAKAKSKPRLDQGYAKAKSKPRPRVSQG